MDQKEQRFVRFDEVQYTGTTNPLLLGKSGKVTEVDTVGIVTVAFGDGNHNKWCFLPGEAAKSLTVTKQARRVSESNLYADEEFRCAKCPTPDICALKKSCGFALPPEDDGNKLLADARDAQVLKQAISAARPLLPHDSDERKKFPLASAFLDYFPSAVVHLANHSFVANEKHNPGQPVHWSRDKSNDHRDAAMRHLIEGDWAGLAWRGMALLQLELESKGHPVAPGARYSTETAR